MKKASIPPRIFWLASALFFISGGTGLAYQVVWFKRFSHVWGSSSLAFAAVGGSFLFGLGLGAYVFGKFADRMGVPLRWYGVCELLIGALALVIPYEIAALVEASVGLYARIPEEPVLRFLVQFCITLVVIGPPCALMGGTLPLLIRQLTSREGSLDQATGWLYAINTFGAAAGCYLTGFHLLPAFGLLLTNNAAAAVNLSIGIISLLVSRSVRRAPVRKAPPLADETESGAGGGSLLAGVFAAAALSGCAALMLEMTWTRQLALVLGGSTYAFTATLFVVLLGIGLGSLIYHWRLRDVRSPSLVAMVVIGMLAVTTLAGKWLLPTLSLLVAPEDVREMRGEPFWNGAICVGISMALEFLPAVGMGLLFPIFVRMTRAGAAHVGAAVGNIYAWNTLGSIAGATFTALLLFPWIGTAGAMALAVGLYVVALLGVMSWRSRADLARCAGVAAAGAAAVALIAQPIDPRLTNLGFYIYGDTLPTENGPDWMSQITPQYFREGASSNVFVNAERSGNVSLRVNGKVDASIRGDMVTQLGLAYFPRILKHDAKDVLVIGFGSGCTSGASLLFPDTRVTCCEIEPAVYGATEQFAEQNHRPQERSRAWLEARNAELSAAEQLTPEQIEAQARFSIIFGDGRTAIQGANKKYDLIISEPSNPWLAGVSNLFTQEFFRAAREHLTDDGVLAQWIQTYSFTLSDYSMIVRTLRSEFPHYGVIVLANGLDTVLLASNRPLLPRPDELAALQKTVDGVPEIQADLKKWFHTTDVRRMLVQNYQLGEEQLKRLVDRDGSQALNTDLHLRLEFDAPLHLFRKLTQRNSATLALLAAIDPKWIARLAAHAGMAPDSGELHFLLAEHLHHRSTNPMVVNPAQKPAEWDKAAAELDSALALEPQLADAHRLMAQIRTLQGRPSDAVASYNALVRLAPEDAVAHAELAQQLLKLKQPAQAVAHFREALRLQRDVSVVSGSFTWANNLAWLLATSPDAKIRNGAEAVEWARKACQADGYKNPSLLDTLAAALAEAGQFDEAIKVSQQMIELAAGEQKTVDSAKARIELFRSSQPFHEE